MLQTVKQNNVITRTIKKSALIDLKKELAKQALTEHEQNVEIMKTIGFDEKTIEGMTAENIDSLFKDVVSFETHTVYMKANTDGTTSVIS